MSDESENERRGSYAEDAPDWYVKSGDDYVRIPNGDFPGMGCNVQSLYLLVIVGTVLGFLIYFAYLAIKG